MIGLRSEIQSRIGEYSFYKKLRSAVFKLTKGFFGIYPTKGKIKLAKKM